MGTLIAIQAEPEVAAVLERSTGGPSVGVFQDVADPTELIARLEQGEQVDAVVLGSGLEEPVRVAQRVHSVDRDVAVLLLSDPGRYDQLSRALQFAPLLGEDVGCLSTADLETVVGKTQDALTRVRKRRSYRATIAAASADVAALGSLQPRAEQYLDRLLDYAPIGVVAVDERGLILAWNRRAGEIFGTREREVLGTSLTHLFSGEERKKLGGLVSDSFAAGRQVPSGIVRRRAEEGAQFLETTVAALAGRFGRRGAIVLIQDVTERRRAEEALRESEERFRLLAEQAVEGIALVEGGRIIDANHSFLEMFGYDLDTLLGTDVVELVVPHLREEVARRLATRDTQPYEARVLRRDGNVFPVEVRPRYIPYHGRQVRVTSVIDLTERERAEEARREVREAERRRIARELHDGVLQDLAYTVQAMEVTKLQARGTGIETELQQEIDALRAAAQEVRAAVHHLRLADELDQPFFRLLESLVERNREMSRGQWIGLEVKEEFPSEPLGETGAEMLRILQEALTNVRRHSGARSVMVRLWAEGEHLVAEVSDDGQGFGPGTAPGVGLRSMRERAASLGGTLEVGSVPGRGTTVWLRVPKPKGI